MKKKLTSVFWGVYILLGVLGFFVVMLTNAIVRRTEPDSALF